MKVTGQDSGRESQNTITIYDLSYRKHFVFLYCESPNYRAKQKLQSVILC